MKIDIEEMLDFLGVHNIEHKGREIWFTCPFSGHTTDSNTNASFREADNHPWWIFRCFVCGRRGTTMDFVAEAEGLTGAFSRTKAKIWLKEKYGTEWHDPGDGLIDEVEKILSEGSKKRQLKRPLIGLPESLVLERAVDWEAAWNANLNDPEPPPAWSTYFFKRGFTWRTLEEWEIGFDPISKMLTIPYRDAKGRLLGLKGRAWWEGAKPRYRFLGNKPGREDRYDFDTADISQVVFGLHRVEPAFERLIVVEGEVNRIMMDQFGHRRVVGISGQYLSEFQQAQIISLTDNAVLIFDEDEKALKAAAEIGRKIRVQIVPARECDPADASDELVAHWLDHLADPSDFDDWYDED